MYLTNSPSFRAFHWNLVLVEIKCCLKKAKHTLVFLEICNFSSRKWILPNHPNLRYSIIQMSAHECFSNHFYTLNNIQKACNLDTKWSCFARGLLVFSFPLQCWTVGHSLQKASDCIILLTFAVGCQFLTSSYRGRLLRNSYQFWNFIRTVWSSQVTKVCLREKKGKVPEAENWIHK